MSVAPRTTESGTVAWTYERLEPRDLVVAVATRAIHTDPGQGTDARALGLMIWPLPEWPIAKLEP